MGKKDKGAVAPVKAKKPKRNKDKYNNKRDKKRKEANITTGGLGIENPIQPAGEYAGSNKKEKKRRHDDETPASDLQLPTTETNPAKKRKLEPVIDTAQAMEIDSEAEPDATPKKLKTKKEKKHKRDGQDLPADEEDLAPKLEKAEKKSKKDKKAKKDKKDKKKKDKKVTRYGTPESDEAHSGGEEEDQGVEKEPKEDLAATNGGETERPTPKMTKEERKAAKKLRKAETKQRRAEEAAAAAGPSSTHNDDSSAEDTQPLPKKVKKAKKAAKLEKGKKEKAAGKEEPPKTEEVSADLSERWNVQALGGGSTRQGKFMRLLGGKKHGATVASGTGDGPREHVDVDRVADDLERQFAAGIRMKYESSGQKRAGLGS